LAESEETIISAAGPASATPFDTADPDETIVPAAGPASATPFDTADPDETIAIRRSDLSKSRKFLVC